MYKPKNQIASKCVNLSINNITRGVNNISFAEKYLFITLLRKCKRKIELYQ